MLYLWRPAYVTKQAYATLASLHVIHVTVSVILRLLRGWLAIIS